MIESWYGPPGSGKTTLSISSLLTFSKARASDEDFKANSICIFSNASCLPRKEGGEYLFAEQEDKLKEACGQLNGFDIKLFPISEGVFSTGNLLLMVIDGYLNREHPETKIFVEKENGFDYTKIYSKLDAFFEQGVDNLVEVCTQAIFFLDEAQAFAPVSTREAGFSGLVIKKGCRCKTIENLFSKTLDAVGEEGKSLTGGEKVSFLYQYSRHFGWDIVLTTQSHESILKSLRALIEANHAVANVGKILGIFGNNVAIRDIKCAGGYPSKKKGELETVHKPSEVKKYFDIRGDTPPEVVIPNEWMRKVMKLVFAIIAIGLIAFIFGSYFGVKKILGFNDNNFQKHSLPSETTTQQPAEVSSQVGQAVVGQAVVAQPIREREPTFGSFEGVGCLIENVLLGGGFIECSGYAIIGNRNFTKVQLKFINLKETKSDLNVQQNTSAFEFASVGSYSVEDLTREGVNFVFNRSNFTVRFSCKGENRRYTQSYLTEYMIVNGTDAPYLNDSGQTTAQTSFQNTQHIANTGRPLSIKEE